MRVVHVFKDAYPPTYGGVEQHIWDVSRSLQSQFEFAVLTSSRSRQRVEERVDGIRYVRTPELGRLLSTPITPAWWSELRRDDGAILHVHLPSPVAEAACAARGAPAPEVVSFHADIARNPLVNRGYTLLRHRFLSRARRIVVSSPVLADTSPVLARHRDRVVVVPYGVDPGDWPIRPGAVAAIRRAHPGPLVLFLGRLVHYKGVEVLLEAMRRVDATLLMVGDGPRRRALEAVAAHTGLGSRPCFLGHVSDEERSAYYQAADVFVLASTSRAEAFGIAMLEAMAWGTPAVCTEVGTGTSWVNQAGETGLVVPPGDPSALAEALSTLLADDDRRRRMGAAAARRAGQHFSKQAMLDGLAGLYRSAAHG